MINPILCTSVALLVSTVVIFLLFLIRSSMKTTCAACGRSGDDLKTCTACKSVRYCNVDCQRTHRKAHKAECKRIEKGIQISQVEARLRKFLEKDAATTMKDVDLFSPNLPPREECPICLVNLPLDVEDSTFYSCCGKVLCSTCIFGQNEKELLRRNKEDIRREMRGEAAPQRPPIQMRCPFCRRLSAVTDKEELNYVKERMEKKDARAHDTMAGFYLRGTNGLPKDELKAMDLFVSGGELGSAEALYNLAVEYRDGNTVVARNTNMERLCLEAAAKRGMVSARCNLADLEVDARNIKLAAKHWLIAAAGGEREVMTNLRLAYQDGQVTKEEYQTALRANQTAIEDMRSDERDLYKKAEILGKICYAKRTGQL